VTIEQATLADAATILALQKLAYQSEAALYEDFTIPPLRQTLDELKSEIESQVVLKALVEGRLVGSVRAGLHGQSCRVGRLIVHPDFQDRGIGTRLMNEIERRFGEAERFELFTGHRSERNLHLYGKLGYRPFRRERVGERLELVYLEKGT
jgi:ribosomal protein S18 acetylase RimI-like enzyme